MSLILDRDLGTPASTATATVSLTIDGAPVTAPEGTSILRAAALAVVDIPRLCATRTPGASKWPPPCRWCEIEGRAGTPASCTTPVAEGMAVRTASERLERLRHGVMELYLSDHAPDRFSGEIRDAAARAGVTRVRYGATRTDAAQTPTPISPTIRPSASSARAACAPARRCRAPSR